jgi:hypothetical protein
MDNPFKTGRLAKLCTRVGKREFPLRERRPVHEKKEIQTRNWRRDVRAIRPWRSTTSFRKAPCGGISPAGTLLRGGSEEKALGGATVAVKQFPKQGPPVQIRLPAQGEKVPQYLLPYPAWLGGTDTTQVVPTSEHGMGTPKASKDRNHPVGHQPGGHLTVRINFHRSPVEPLLPPLPTSQAQEQSPQDRAGRVLEIGDQLNRQQREGSRAPSAHKAGYGDASLLNPWKQLNGVAPIGTDRPVAMLLPANGAGGADEGGKINPTGKERFRVFPNRSPCVRVGKLNLSAALPTGGQVFGCYAIGSAPLWVLVIFPRSIPDPGNSPTLISPVKIPRKSSSPFLRYIEGDNKPRRRMA